MQYLVNKDYKKYDKISRYSNFPFYYHLEDNKYIYGITSWLSDDTPYTLHKVAYKDTLDKLALYYYGSPTKYWVIADFNRIDDPFKELEPDTFIKVPTLTMIEFE